MNLLLRIAPAFAVTLMLCMSAQAAGLFRAYVASNGSDANPCTLAQPCRLLPAALAAVADGGEIWMLDSANFNTTQVNIAKSVTILAIPGAVGSIVATGGFAGIYIDAPSVKVSLRNLVVVHLTSSNNGIHFQQGAELNVAECEIVNVEGIGINAAASGSRVTVRNTAMRGPGSGFVAYSGVVASLDGVHITGELLNVGVYANTGSRVTLSNSVLSGHYAAAQASANGGTTRMIVERTVLTGNSQGITAASTTAGDVVEVTASGNTVTHNVSFGFSVLQMSSTTATLVADGNTVTENDIGIFFNTGPPGTTLPTIYSRGNNTVKFNTNDVMGGSLTALAGM